MIFLLGLHRLFDIFVHFSSLVHGKTRLKVPKNSVHVSLPQVKSSGLEVNFLVHLQSFASSITCETNTKIFSNVWET